MSDVYDVCVGIRKKVERMVIIKDGNTSGTSSIRC